MTTDHSASEAAETFPAESCTDKDPEASQDSAKSSTEDSSTSSATPTFAFAVWKAELELMLQRESEALHESVQSLQSDFDDRSQFIRGDFAWRKQITAFHDRLQDVLTNQLNDLATSVSKHAAQVAESLAQTLAKVERDGQRAVHQQEQKGEAAVRRVRTASAKEVERVARLEKCLRLEEARQATAILAERERQLTEEHNARESHLQALLGDMRASNDSLEALNTQLLEAVRTSRSELQQLRNTLVRSMSRPKARVSCLSHSESRNADNVSRSCGDKSSKNSTSRDSEGFPSTANELLLVPQLRQSLKEATQTVEKLKARVSELESTWESDKQRLRDTQLALAQADNEKAKATKLLGEARLALIDNDKKLVEAANENARLQGKLDTLQALAQGREQALVDSQRLEDATRDQLAALMNRLERVTNIEVRWCEFEHAVNKWRETQKESNAQSSETSGTRSLERVVESFLSLETREVATPITLLTSLETQKELEIRLQYEFERRFGQQLNVRISHERRHVLQRLESLCAAEAKDKQERPQHKRQSVSRTISLESDYSRLKRLMKGAYDQLGICVGPWSETDLDGLHARLEALKSQVQTLENKLEAAANRAESQRVSLVRAELAQQEKDLLLAELTSRFRQLRSAQVAWENPQQVQLQHRQPIVRKPLTVYGIPQPMVQKTRLQALTQLSVRSRPTSAAACLESVAHQSPCRVSHAPPSRLGSRSASNRTIFDLQRKSKDKRVEEVEEHVCSVLKSALMRSEMENQLEDAVGSDGVLEILHRRRHRK
ncbi:hypothetical protein L914_19495 [Phytophthora nicotianae]|uniref:Uncharacterized protein n=2 Tax=Phytophthora nicotianae TaxID=4792 RepID=V9E3A5_PHYNI|nr:hypothetical protein F443_20278 [Phytophthora nicotianae P1569]ETM33234.1 hypothetical protein L914_19495 [Phytophthora nicotianae]